MKLRLLIPVLVLATTRIASGWSDDGHQLVAQIAYGRLTAAEQQKLDAIISDLNQGNAHYNAVSVACWADDTKTNATRKWHYIDIPVGAGPAAPLPNVVSAINAQVAAATALKTAPNTPANRLKRAKAIAYLIHLIGDIHQPMRAAEHNGDGGGGAVSIQNSQPHSNLHHFWDGAYAVRFDNGQAVVPGNGPRPTSAQDAAFKQRAQAIVSSSAPGFNWNHLGNSYDAWAQETHVYGVNYAYGKLQPAGMNSNPATLNAAYVTGAKSLANKRIALAGYRLAAVLSSVL